MDSNKDAIDETIMEILLFRIGGMTKAINIYSYLEQKNLPSNQYIPDLSCYTLKTLEELEIQQFNLYQTAPKRTYDDYEAIAMFILENTSLDRLKVAKYFVSNTHSSKKVLQIIAKKICSMRAGEGFVDGLKLFLPAIGYYERFFYSINSKGNNLSELKSALTVYIEAHLEHSKNLILYNCLDFYQQHHRGMGSHHIMPLLIEVAVLIIEVLQVMDPNHDDYYCKRKAPSQMMADFFNDMRSIIRGYNSASQNQYSATNNLNKQLSDIYSAITASSISAVIIPPTTPSYLFSQVFYEGFLLVSFSHDENRRLFYCRLCRDAVYLFQNPNIANTNTSNNNNNYNNNNKIYQSPNSKQRASVFEAADFDDLCACIPLLHCFIQRSSEADILSHTLELLNTHGHEVPVVYFSTEQHQHKHDSSDSSTASDSKPATRNNFVNNNHTNNHNNDYSSSFFITSPGRGSHANSFSNIGNVAAYEDQTQPITTLYSYKAPRDVSFHPQVFLEVANFSTGHDSEEAGTEVLLGIYSHETSADSSSGSSLATSHFFQQLETWHDCIESCCMRLRDETLSDGAGNLVSDQDLQQLMAWRNETTANEQKDKDQGNENKSQENTREVSNEAIRQLTIDTTAT